MPINFYSQQEYAELKQAYDVMKKRAEAAEALRPLWAKGFDSRSVAVQTLNDDLEQLWRALGAKNQTEAVLAVNRLSKLLPKP